MDLSSDSSHEPHEGSIIVDQDGVSDLVNKDVKSEADWDLLLGQAIKRSSMNDLTPEQHSNLWNKIIECANVKPNHGDALVECCTEAVRSTPSVPVEKDNKHWMTLIEKMYKDIVETNLTYEKAEKFFNVAEKKFSNSFSKASRYWNLVRKCERQLDRKNNLGKEECTRKYVEMYKKQFSCPYPLMEADYQKFNAWVKEQKVANSLRMEVQEVYFSSAEEATYLSDVYPTTLLLSFPELHSCVTRLLHRPGEGPPLMNTIHDLCEEMISAEPASVNTYSVYVDALTSGSCSDSNEEHNTKLFSVLKRALKLGIEKACLHLFARFLEMALFSASIALTKEKVIELVNDVIKLYKLGVCDASIWFASRKAILIAIKNLIQRSELDKEDLKEYFQKALLPTSFNFCYKNEFPEECSKVNNFEIRIMLLFKQWIILEQTNKLWTNQEMIGHWIKLFSENNNPITLLGYTTFIRQYGCEETINEAYTTVLNRVEESSYVSCTTYLARRCFLQIIADYLDYSVALNKPAKSGMSPQKLSKELWNVEAHFSANFTESYDLNLGYIQTDAHAEAPVCPSVAGSSPQRSAVTGSSVESVVRHMVAVSIDPEQQDERISGEASVQDNDVHLEENLPSTCKGYPIFIANANFKATEQDIIDAFKESGVTVLSVSLKKTIRGTSLGYGTVEIATQEEAERALLTMDRIPILGRATFLSRHRNEQKNVNKFARPAFDGPTLVVISDLPKEWANPSKISNELAPYGHIKSITVEDKTEPAVAKVEYYMPGDCDNVIEQWQQGNIFRGVELSLRKGFVGKKRPNPSSQPKHKERQKHREPKHRPEKSSSSSKPLDNGEEAKETAPKSKAPPRMFAFVPQQVRRTQVQKTHMKHRLAVPSATSAGEPAAASNHTTASPSDITMSPEAEKTSPEGSPPAVAAKKQMTNEDFKNMLLQK